MAVVGEPLYVGPHRDGNNRPTTIMSCRGWNYLAVPRRHLGAELSQQTGDARSSRHLGSGNTTAGFCVQKEGTRGTRVPGFCADPAVSLSPSLPLRPHNMANNMSRGGRTALLSSVDLDLGSSCLQDVRILQKKWLLLGSEIQN